MTPLLLSVLLAASPGLTDGGLVVANGRTFLAEVARTQPEQERGLMFRKSLENNRCMIFIYDQDGQHRIWMKNCLIYLDVVWVKEDGTVVETCQDVPPCSPVLGDDCPVYGGTLPARHFIEFAKGTVRKLGLKVGQRLGWNLTLSTGEKVVGGLPVPQKGPRKLKKVLGA